MASLNSTVAAVTERIIERSRASRSRYLERVARVRPTGTRRGNLDCGNLAHAIAACSSGDKRVLADGVAGNLGIITAYNDMLSAHQPFETYPSLIKQAARDAGGIAQVAGGVPAMCDGVTQGKPGMELSLFSRDTIAMAAAIALSHDAFDAAVFLGVCDKIVPGLVIAAATFGHLPAVFIPAGPMTSGLSNDEKTKVRQQFAAGEISRADLLAAEMKSYHGPGTCTFYGTANSNQMLMEIMGLHLPGASFVTPGTPLRDALTRSATSRALEIVASGNEYIPAAEILSEKNFVNGIVGLHATGGSTNLVIHLIAMARAAGIVLKPDDFADMSAVCPLIARVYPNGSADVNHFHAAGGMAFLIRELLAGGLLHEDVLTVMGRGLSRYTQEPFLERDGALGWRHGSAKSLDESVLRSVSRSFESSGGLVTLRGNLGAGVMKASAVQADKRIVEAPARVFESQEAVKEAFKRDELNRDFVCVVRFQGPQANGMPELHGLMPILGLIQAKGHRVALVTDGRLSGASGKVPSAIHVVPEAAAAGPIARIRDGDVVRVDGQGGTLDVVSTEDDWKARLVTVRNTHDQIGVGRELFTLFRRNVSSAESGASSLVLAETLDH